VFYKNGQMVHNYKNLYQKFYCVALSLFNFAQIEISLSPNPIYAMGVGSKHYFWSLFEKIPYKQY